MTVKTRREFSEIGLRVVLYFLIAYRCTFLRVSIYRGTAVPLFLAKGTPASSTAPDLLPS